MLDTSFWKKYFRVYDVLNIVIPYQELMQNIITSLDPRKNELILDAGSGTGNLSILLKLKGADVVSIDSAQAGCDIHRSKDPNARIKCCDLLVKLPFPDQYFDKIACNNVLYSIHPSKRAFVISEFNRILKPGGRLVLSNLKEGWKPINIYLEHIKKDVTALGIIKVIMKATRLVSPTIKMFYYNSIINKASGKKQIRFMLPNEQTELLEDNGFQNISTKQVYANQAIMNVAVKR